jgi:hypothetical protein
LDTDKDQSFFSGDHQGIDKHLPFLQMASSSAVLRTSLIQLFGRVQ